MTYSLLCWLNQDASGDLRRVKSSGDMDFTQTSIWNASEFIIYQPGEENRLEDWLLSQGIEFRDYKIFYDPTTQTYAQGDEIVRISPEIQQYLADNVIWTDPLTGTKGPPAILMGFDAQRELYNASDNPLYIPGFKGVVERVGNLENIHSKLGWHNQQIVESRYKKPVDMLIYYGWLNSFNSAENGWNNENVSQDMAKYDVLVFGNGLADPSHGDYANTTTIVSRIKALKPNAKIFGYADTVLALADFQTQVDNWQTLGVHGIFMDKAGYDYGTSRVDYNVRVDYIHDQNMIVMANAWNGDHVIGVVDDPTYPNTTYNPSGVESNLNINDWYLLESAPINTTAYSGNDGYQSGPDWAARGVKAIGHRATYGINLAACGIINDDNTSGQNLFDFGFVAALMFSLEAWGTSHISYGSIQPQTKFWLRPNVSDLVVFSWLNPSVQLDANNSNIYHRFIGSVDLNLNFALKTFEI